MWQPAGCQLARRAREAEAEVEALILGTKKL